ncbi:MAG: extracellular solute-binding protein, partial [Spirochaetales bacterium]|nr:extracellular solute-binding protein [Spirochaetales bacterium]
MKKLISVSLVLLLICGAAFATGSQEAPADGKSKLRFATTWGEADSKGVYFMPMLEEFAAQNADSIDLEIETYNSDDMVTKITVELASGELPDMFSYWGGKQRLGPLVEGEALLDMSKYFAESDLSESDFTSAGIDHFTIDGVIRGLPMEANVAAFVCNKEIFDMYGLELPETFDDMIAAGKVLRANGIIPFAMASNGGNPSHFWFS